MSARLLIQIVLQGIRQCSILKIAYRMCDKSCGLVDHNEPGIFVNDRQGQIDRFQQFIRRFNQPERHTLIAKHTLIRICRNIINRAMPAATMRCRRHVV